MMLTGQLVSDKKNPKNLYISKMMFYHLTYLSILVKIRLMQLINNRNRIHQNTVKIIIS